MLAIIMRSSILEEYPVVIQTENGNPKGLTIVDLRKKCTENVCLRETTLAVNSKKTSTVCIIQWRDSTFSKVDTSSRGIENITRLLVLTKTENSFNLQWNLTHAPLLANIKFNLTILCYDDEDQNITTVEKSFLVFQTTYVIIPKERSANRTRLYLAISLPLAFLLLVFIALALWFFRRKKRRKESTSTDNLHGDDTRYHVNGRVNVGLESKSENNPFYEKSPAPHPAVTIARNKLYERTRTIFPRKKSEVYEQPFEFKVRENKLYECGNPSNNSPKLKHYPTPKTSPKPSPKHRPDPRPTQSPPTPPRSKIPKVINPPEDVYDQPLGFIPSLMKNENEGKGENEIHLQNLDSQRIHSTYEKPLPDSPASSGIYEYATREDMVLGKTQCQAEKPLESTKERKEGGSVNSNGSLYEAPHYDMLEKD